MDEDELGEEEEEDARTVSSRRMSCSPSRRRSRWAWVSAPATSFPRRTPDGWPRVGPPRAPVTPPSR